MESVLARVSIVSFRLSNDREAEQERQGDCDTEDFGGSCGDEGSSVALQPGVFPSDPLGDRKFRLRFGSRSEYASYVKPPWRGDFKVRARLRVAVIGCGAVCWRRRPELRSVAGERVLGDPGGVQERGCGIRQGDCESGGEGLRLVVV